MQYRRSFLSLALAATVIPAFAQAPASRYVVSLRYKVDPAKVAEHREFVKNTTAKVMAEWLKINPKFLGWSAFELNYGGSPLADYNFSASFLYDGPPPENINDTFQAAVKNAGLTYEAYQAKTRALRTLVGSQLRRTLVNTTRSVSGDWAVVHYYKANPAKRAEYVESLRNISLPVFSLMAKDKVIAGWSFSEVVFPRGQSFDFVASTSYETLADAIEKDRSIGSTYATYFPKVHPGRNYISFVDLLRESRTHYRSDLLHRIARVAR